MARLSRPLVAVMFIGALAGSRAALAQPAVGPDSLERMNQSIDALTRKVWPSVVQIVVTGYGAQEERSRGEVNAVVTRQRSI